MAVRVVMTRAMWRMIVIMVVIMVVIMIMLVAMVVMMMAVMVVMMAHRGPQKLTGLLMMCLWLPSLPWATIEPSASTTTRTPISAVMSEVS